MNNTVETWVDIEGFEGFYQISSFGSVRSLTRVITYSNPDQKGTTQGTYQGTVRKIRVGRNGYPEVLLNKVNHKTLKRIHRLVAIHFIPNPENLPEVNHIDGNKLNYSIPNLEWCDRSTNNLHAFATGLSQQHKGADNAYTKPVNQMSLNGEFIKRFESVKSVELDGYSASSVNSCCLKRPRYNTHKGFKWEFAEKLPLDRLAFHCTVVDNKVTLVG